MILIFDTREKFLTKHENTLLLVSIQQQTEVLLYSTTLILNQTL